MSQAWLKKGKLSNRSTKYFCKIITIKIPDRRPQNRTENRCPTKRIKRSRNSNKVQRSNIRAEVTKDRQKGRIRIGEPGRILRFL